MLEKPPLRLSALTYTGCWPPVTRGARAIPSPSLCCSHPPPNPWSPSGLIHLLDDDGWLNYGNKGKNQLQGKKPNMNKRARMKPFPLVSWQALYFPMPERLVWMLLVRERRMNEGRRCLVCTPLTSQQLCSDFSCFHICSWQQSWLACWWGNCDPSKRWEFCPHSRS